MFLEIIKFYVILFKFFIEVGVKKLFLKVKKLKVFFVDSIDLMSIFYVSWIDKGLNRKFIVV